MKRLLATAGAGLTTLGLGGVVAYLVAVASTSGRHSALLFWVFGGVAAVGAVGYLAGQERLALGTNQRQAASVATAPPELSSEDEPSMLVREAEANPSHVVLQAWEQLSAAIADVVGVALPARRVASRNPVRSLPELVKRELVPGDFASAVTELRIFRNQVAHGQSKPTPGEAVEYAESAQNLADVARSLS